jgi:hypothetical protein
MKQDNNKKTHTDTFEKLREKGACMMNKKKKKPYVKEGRKDIIYIHMAQTRDLLFFSSQCFTFELYQYHLDVQVDY